MFKWSKHQIVTNQFLVDFASLYCPQMLLPHTKEQRVGTLFLLRAAWFTDNYLLNKSTVHVIFLFCASWCMDKFLSIYVYKCTCMCVCQSVQARSQHCVFSSTIILRHSFSWNLELTGSYSLAGQKCPGILPCALHHFWKYKPDFYIMTIFPPLSSLAVFLELKLSLCIATHV